MASERDEINELKVQVHSLLVIAGALAKHTKLDPAGVQQFADQATQALAEPARTAVRGNIAQLAKNYTQVG